MKNTLQELRANSVEALNDKLIELRKSAYGLRVQLSTQQHAKTSEKRHLRRMIARVKTIVAEKQAATSQSKE